MSGARLCFNHGKSRSQVGHEKRLGFRRIWATCLREDPASECVLRKVRKEGFLIENLKIHGVWKSSTPCSSKNGTAPPFAVHREPRQNQFSMFQQDERFPEGRSVDTLQQPDMRDESSEVAPVAALRVRAGLAFEPQIDDCESLYLADLVTIMQRILSRVPNWKRPQICASSMAPCLKFHCAKPPRGSLEAYVF